MKRGPQPRRCLGSGLGIGRGFKQIARETERERERCLSRGEKSPTVRDWNEHVSSERSRRARRNFLRMNVKTLRATPTEGIHTVSAESVALAGWAPQPPLPYRAVTQGAVSQRRYTHKAVQDTVVSTEQRPAAVQGD